MEPAGLCVIELRWWKAEADADRRSEIYNEQKDVKRAKSSASGTFATAFLTARQTPALGDGQRQANPGESGEMGDRCARIPNLNK